MNNFIKKSTLFVLYFLVLTYLVAIVIERLGIYKDHVHGSEVYHSIEKSKQVSQAKKLLLGDSVGNQLFPNKKCNDTINSLACNQAISLIGHYILLNNYLEAGNLVSTVYLIYVPKSFLNNLDQLYTYHYFLKPFYNKEYISLISANAQNQINKIPYHDLCQIPYSLTTNWAPVFNPKDEKNYTFLSPISVEYLKKIKELGEKYNFKLIMLPPLVSDQEKPTIDKIDKKEIEKNKLTDVFKNYFTEMIFINDSNFYSDGTHLLNAEKHVTYYKNRFMK